MTIKFVDLKAQYDECKLDLDKAYQRVMESGWYILGNENLTLEQEFAEFVGAKYCVTVGSGLDALKLLLQALDIGEGDEVIVPANTFIATILAVTAVGAKPVLVEPDPNSFNIDVKEISQAITKNTKAVLGVHLYGQTFCYKKIKALTDAHNIFLLEDAAQAHGANYQEQNAGTLGLGAAFSFYPGKNLGAFGDGGAITTNNHELAEKVRMLRNYGSREKYVHELQGENSRLDELQAAFLRVKLTHMNRWNIARQSIASQYIEQINNNYVQLPQVTTEFTSVWHLFVIKCDYRAQLVKHLSDAGITTMVHYPIPVYKQKAYQGFFPPAENYPITEMLSNQILSLPIHPHMTLEEVDKVIAAVNSFSPE